MVFYRQCLIFVSLLLVFAAGAGASAGAEDSAIPPEIIDALKSLKTANASQRQAVYDLLGQKGDARLIPAIKAYKDGALQLRDGRLCIFGERINIPGQGSVLPLTDAITGQVVNGSDGKPAYFLKPDLSRAIKSPPRPERTTIADLISTLSLLDPDKETRIASIRDVAERSSRAFIDTVDQKRFAERLASASAEMKAGGSDLQKQAAAMIDDALKQKPRKLTDAVPDAATTMKLSAIVAAAQKATPLPAGAEAMNSLRDYQDRLDAQQKVLDDLPKYSTALHRQQSSNQTAAYAAPLKEAVASLDAVLGDRPAQLAAVKTLGEVSTSRADLLLDKIVDAARSDGDIELLNAAEPSLKAANRYQMIVRIVQNTFAGVSAGSILVLLALGLSIVFGLMGVINMAHGEFMMVGAFTTFVVSEWFKRNAPGMYDYYLVAAIPAAFLVAGSVGLLCEWLVIRHLYGRPLETLLATWGIGLILIQFARGQFGDNQSVKPPHWMEGGVEVAADLVFPLNRVYIILFCAICIFVVYFIVNRTKLGLMLRATTQNREMAAALGVATRRVDALTFALGAGLAGLAGVAVPLYNKINPSIGQEYIVDSFMVVVVGGVGKLAGAIFAGLGLGFLSKYLEPLFQSIPALASGASVIGKVVVLGLVVVFLQWRPSGLFPPKGRMADM